MNSKLDLTPEDEFPEDPDEEFSERDRRDD